MLKSPEEYFSEMEFNPVSEADANTGLNAGERAFINKYLGEETFARLRHIDPEPYFKPITPKPVSRTIFAEPKIEVAPKKIVVAPEKPAPASVASRPATEKLETTKTASTELPIAPKPVVIAIEKPAVAKTASQIKTEAPVAVRQKIREEDATKLEATEISRAKPATAEPVKKTARVIHSSEQKTESMAVEAEKSPESISALKERLRLEPEIQMVSFYVSGQLFLLPVAAIQEVLRSMELVKVPKAPPFIAGVINLRGRVTPLVYLSAILTDTPNPVYNEKNFVIICGSDNLQLGLIIDKISGMHTLPQNRLIWNVEAKLGEAGEYLLALAELEDRARGVIAPEIIRQKILYPA
ncbi:MAG: chemotaxis protein CheW [Desulfovibrio sp.]|nr:chemotaxis protein CheW [Desulfovibrio sp.]